MELPRLVHTETNLRQCLVLKADDILFTLAEPYGERASQDFLGVSFDGLADDLPEEAIASIDLDRFAIARRVRRLHKMVEERWLSADDPNRPDPDSDRQNDLDFLEHFLSTLPDVALGGNDMTSARNGEVRRLYELAYAWLNLTETIEGAFFGEAQSSLAITDLALLSGLNIRSVRNDCGPKKRIRTSETRAAHDRGEASSAFVSLHSLDAVDWLRARKKFQISQIDPAWIHSRLPLAPSPTATRGLVIAGIVNLGPLEKLAPMLGVNPDNVRDWFDRGEPLPTQAADELSKRLNL